MKKILGLDIGTTSIGWAIIEASDEKKINPITGKQAETDINNDRIGIYEDAVGVRIIPAEEMQRRFDQGKKLNEGEKLTPTANRRVRRSSRRMKSRYKLRRDKLINVLNLLGMLPDGAFYRKKNDKNEWEEVRTNSAFYSNVKGERGAFNDIGKALYKLRDKATREEVSLKEWGRIILHLNQLRGYSSDRFKKEENEKFDYFSGTVIEISEKPVLIKYDDESESVEMIPEKNDRIIWKKYLSTIKLDKPIKEENEDGSERIIEFVKGNIYTRELKFLKNNSVTFRYKEYKKETKIEYVNPNPNDWKTKYKLLNQTLEEWCANGSTVGSYFYQNFYLGKNIDRIRNNVVNRDWYEAEFDKIFDKQFAVHQTAFANINIDEILKVAFKSPQIRGEVKKINGVKEQLRFLIKEKIIFYQRPWQQSKNKGRCKFEKVPDAKKPTEHIGRTVIPRSHPVHQEFKIWQQINNVRIWFHLKDEKPLELMTNNEECYRKLGKYPAEIKELLYAELQIKKEKSWRTFVNDTFGNIDIKINQNDKRQRYSELEHYSVNFIKRNKKGIEQDNKLKGNTTLCEIRDILKNVVDESWYHSIYKKTGISNLQLLWQLIYDITLTNQKNVERYIKKHFSELAEQAEALSKIKFDDSGMGNLSAKAIRNILPLMKDGGHWSEYNFTDKCLDRIKSLIELNNSNEEANSEEKLKSLKEFIPDKNTRLKLSGFKDKQNFKGLNYWEAIAVIYGSHSTKKINQIEILERIPRHSMNNLVVEKIVNETLMLVNDIKIKYDFDEIRIELSRELKANIDEREQMWDAIQNNTSKIEWAKAMLRELKKDDENNILNLDTNNKNNIDKIKIFEDIATQKAGKEEFEKIKKTYNINPKEPSKSDLKKYLLWLDQHFKCPYTDQPIPLTDVFSKYKRVEIEHIIPIERYYDNSYSNKVITWTEVNSLKKELGNRTAYEFIVSKRGKDDNIKLASGKTVQLVPKEKWEEHIKIMFPKGRKQRNLLSQEIPEDPINRQLKETQYINKKLKGELERLCSEKVWTTTGSVTDILRERWHLNNVMKELMRDRFENFDITVGKNKFEPHTLIQSEKVDKETGEIIPEKFDGYSKRLDYRHHALDAIIIACTKQSHIQYLNLLNQVNSADQESDDEKKKKYKELKQQICEGNSSKKFYTPWREDDFIPKVKDALENIIISHKNVRLLISPSKHRNRMIINAQKIASVRGELHKETNYAKRNYYKGEKVKIKTIVKELLRRKMENQNQTMISKRSFADLIKEYVFKDKYQKELIPIFEKYDSLQLNDKKEKETQKENEQSVKVILKEITNDIEANKVLFNYKENKPLEWLTVFANKNASARPNGLEMNLNDVKEVKDIANPRIKRLAAYRLNYIDQKCEEIDKQNLDKKEKDKLKSAVKSMPLFSNAIYEVRIRTENKKFEWIELKYLTPAQFDKIEYAKVKISKQVKEKLLQVINENNNNYSIAFSNYFEKPIFISKTPILVKKARQLAWVSDLFEIAPKKYVNASDTFMAYIFSPKSEVQAEEGKPLKREIKILKFLEAINIINQDKPDKIKYSQLIPSPDREKYELAFTLAKNDLVYLPEKALSQDELDAIDWTNQKDVSKHLYVVKVINPSLPQSYFMFQKHLKADAIKINETDAKNLFKNNELKEQTEELKFGNAFCRDNCIKVFTDKLGKTIIPYWKFPNGCWDKEIAKKLGLIIYAKTSK